MRIPGRQQPEGKNVATGRTLTRSIRSCRGKNVATGRTLTRSIRSCPTQGFRPLSGTLFARVGFQSIQTFREWTFGRYGALRQPQRADLPEQWLLPDASNLALVLHQIEHGHGPIFNEYLKRFFPQFERMSTSISGSTVQFYLHESGFSAPISATSAVGWYHPIYRAAGDSAAPEPPSLVCIEEPELGLHPDAVALLADLLVEASQRMQLVVTTHSERSRVGPDQSASRHRRLRAARGRYRVAPPRSRKTR